jgi:hypothetical protein
VVITAKLHESMSLAIESLPLCQDRQRRIARRGALNALATSSERRSRLRVSGRAADPLFAVQTAPPRRNKEWPQPAVRQ